jgi:hypothetical protein
VRRVGGVRGESVRRVGRCPTRTSSASGYWGSWLWSNSAEALFLARGEEGNHQGSEGQADVPVMDYLDEIVSSMRPKRPNTLKLGLLKIRLFPLIWCLFVHFGAFRLQAHFEQGNTVFPYVQRGADGRTRTGKGCYPSRF